MSKNRSKSGPDETNSLLLEFLTKAEERNKKFMEEVIEKMCNSNLENSKKMAQTVDVLSDNLIRSIDKIEVLQQNYRGNVDCKLDTASFPNSLATGGPISENQSNNYITIFKELGGANMVYVPGGSTHPVAFVNKLSETFDNAGVPECRRVNLAINALRGSASVWGDVKRAEFVDFEEFKRLFLARFWGAEKEREAYQRLQFGNYQSGSRADYFMNMLRESRYISNKIKETDVVKLLINHFPSDIKRGIVISGLHTVDEIDEYLRAVDATETNNADGRNNHNNGSRQHTNYNWRRNGNNGDRNNENSRNENNRGREHRGAETREREGENEREVATMFNTNGEDLLEEKQITLRTVNEMPVIKGEVEEKLIEILVDSGSQVTCVSKEFLETLREGKQLLTLPVNATTVVGALNRRSQKVSEQVFLHFKVNEVEFEVVCLVIPTLVRKVILGCDWLFKHAVVINFAEQCLKVEVEGVPQYFPFVSQEIEGEDIKIEEVMIGEDNEKQLDYPVAKCYEVEEIRKIAEKAERFKGQDKEILCELLLKNRKLFSDEPGLLNNYTHKVKLHDYSPFYVKSYPIPYKYKKEVDEQMKEMERWGVISKQPTEYVSPLVIVKKKCGSPRVCLDARFINKRMEKDHVIPPSPGELLFNFSKNQFLSTLDLTASYWQIPIDVEDRKYLGFNYQGHTYVFNVLPFGLTTSVGSFIRGLDAVLGDEVEDFVIPYVDDLLIYSPDADSHLHHLEVVCNKLSKAGMTVKLRKCCFAREQVNFLGHIITSEGLQIDPTRVSSIQNFRTPRNIKELRSFLGLVNYDRRFVEHFSYLTLGLNHLLKKNSKWFWGRKEQEVFEEIKAAFTRTMELKHPNCNVPFCLNTDASAFAIGACLYQVNERGERDVIAYYSRSLKGPELNYTVTEKEASAVVAALKQWRIFVLGHPLIIYTDHKALAFLKSCRLLNSRLTRWILYIQEFDFKIEYFRGAQNKVADTLSRYPCDLGENEPQMPNHHVIELAAIQLNEIEKKLRRNIKNIREAQLNDTVCKKISDELKSSTGKERYKLWYIMHQGILFKRGTINDGQAKLCVPKEYMLDLVNREHEGQGHFGAAKCIEKLSRHYYWPRMHSTIRKIVGSCDLCQKSKISKHVRGEFHSIVPENVNELITVDFMGPLPKGRSGVTQLFVVMDAFSKHVELFALRRATARAVVRCLVGKYFKTIGRPSRILSDNGSQFTSKVYLDAMQDHGVEAIHTSVYFPQGNPVERANREIGRLLRMVCHGQHTLWANVLGKVQDWINNAIHDSLGFTPNEVHFGKVYRDPILKSINFPEGNMNDRNFVVLARERLQSKAEKRKLRRGVGDTVVFVPGDQVLVREHKLSSAEDREIRKFFLLFRGPCTVVSQIRPNAYLIRENSTGRDLGIHNIYNLKPYQKPIMALP